jgi:hypothetical protein
MSVYFMEDKVIKPRIEYSNIDELKKYLEDFAKKYEDAEDLLKLDYNKCDSRVVNGVGLFFTPNIGDVKDSIYTVLETNLDTAWFRKATGYKDTLNSYAIDIEYGNPNITLATSLNSLEESLKENADYSNEFIDKLFQFYGINNYKEVPINFDFQKMKKIRDKSFY